MVNRHTYTQTKQVHTMDSLEFNDSFFNYVRAARVISSNIKDTTYALKRVGMHEIADELLQSTKYLNSSVASLRKDWISLGRDDLKRSQESVRDTFRTLIGIPSE